MSSSYPKARCETDASLCGVAGAGAGADRAITGRAVRWSVAFRLFLAEMRLRYSSHDAPG